MLTFSKFISGRTGCQQLLDSDGHIYSRKKDKDSALKSAWRCSKHCIPTKCPCLCYLTLSDNTLTLYVKTTELTCELYPISSLFPKSTDGSHH